MPTKAFQVEQHGLDPVPRPERTKTWWDLFVIQAGVNITLPSFLMGGLLVPGLSWADALTALALGYLAVSALMVLSGHIGVDHGIPAAVANRFALGYPRGTWFSSLCIVLSLVGWFAVNAELAGLAVNEILAATTGFSVPMLVIVLVGLSNGLPAVLGFESIRWLSTVSVPALLALQVWLLQVVLARHDFSALIHYRPTGEIAFATGVDWTLASLIVGAFIASDFSRYLRSRRHNWAGTLAGVLPASVFLGVVGVLAKLATGDWNPVNAVQALGLGLPALAIIIFATWTTNDTNVYSAGLALTSLVPRLGRWQNTLWVTLAGTALAALRITEHFATFLSLLHYFFVPLVGVLVCDYFLVRRGALALADVYRHRGRFYYWRGMNRAALVALATGVLVAVLTPAEFMASLTSLVASAAAYYLVTRLFGPSPIVQR
ncbi:MAG: purine-cytosine permease family protein [Terriglobia bacterium]